MEKKPYHHGELKKALIENGIEFINQYGEEKLSLRKVAEKCGVSNAAPYAHFKDKDDFINAMQKYVMEAFMNSLTICVNECKDETQILSELGVCYVMFFYHNPLYFDFLFSRKMYWEKWVYRKKMSDIKQPQCGRWFMVWQLYRLCPISI